MSFRPVNLHNLPTIGPLDCWCKITLALKRFRVLIYLCQWEITSALHQQWSYKMSHEVESMAWAHEVPWHGLGNRVEGNVTCDEMLVAAGLDWTVEQIPCFIEIDGQKVPVERKALVRSSDKKILTVTGNNWRPFQNKDAMNFFRDWAAVGGCTLETAGSLHGGKVVWLCLRSRQGP